MLESLFNKIAGLIFKNTYFEENLPTAASDTINTIWVRYHTIRQRSKTGRGLVKLSKIWLINFKSIFYDKITIVLKTKTVETFQQTY